MVDQLEEKRWGKHPLDEMPHQNVVGRKNLHHMYRPNGCLQVIPGLESSGFVAGIHNTPISAVEKGLNWNNASMRNNHVILG